MLNSNVVFYDGTILSWLPIMDLQSKRQSWHLAMSLLPLKLFFVTTFKRSLESFLNKQKTKLEVWTENKVCFSEKCISWSCQILLFWLTVKWSCQPSKCHKSCRFYLLYLKIIRVAVWFLFIIKKIETLKIFCFQHFLKQCNTERFIAAESW